METCQRGDRNATVAVAVESIKPLVGNDPRLYETRKITPHAYFSVHLSPIVNSKLVTPVSFVAEASGPYRTQCGIIKLVDHDLT